MSASFKHTLGIDFAGIVGFGTAGAAQMTESATKYETALGTPQCHHPYHHRKSHFCYQSYSNARNHILAEQFECLVQTIEWLLSLGNSSMILICCDQMFNS